MMVPENLILKTDDDSQCVGWFNQELSYIGRDCYKIPPILSKIYGPHALKFDLSYNCLTNLTGLEHFVKLEELILDNNSLTDDVYFPPSPHLIGLSLNKNNFKDLTNLIEVLRQAYPNLKYLSLLGNDACPDQLSNIEKDADDYRRYRLYVIYKLPSLTFLDSSKVKISERKEANRVGEFLTVVRPDLTTLSMETEIVEPSAPEPDDEIHNPFGSHTSAYGKLRYKYTGKHSEGNRFIGNKDL